jgi:hypothetical protein
MPVYCYKCPKCGVTHEELLPMPHSDDVFVCDDCDVAMDRDYAAENGAVVGSELARPFWSESLAISPDQATEHREKFPDVLVDREGRVGFVSHKQRERYLETCGFVKNTAKLKRRSYLPRPRRQKGPNETD